MVLRVKMQLMVTIVFLIHIRLLVEDAVGAPVNIMVQQEALVVAGVVVRSIQGVVEQQIKVMLVVMVILVIGVVVEEVQVE